MIEADSTLGSDAPTGAPAAPVADWSDVRGFQVVPHAGAEAAAAPADPEAYAVELAKELDVRAARFAQSVDESIVLSSDGVIRWLGDPIARLIGGDDVLKPRSVLLADEALAPEGRQTVEARLALWITAHIRKVLGALETLAEAGEIGEPARELALRIVQAFGVLERERVRAQVKNLDQGARAALRKLGVRFGAFYIYVPSLLKPGARTLCSQLWSLRRGTEPGAERLLAFAASGRTSFPAEAPLGPETYRVAGFRLCGDRVVRVDIVERLTDLIRAAIPDHMRPGGRAAGEASGFVISPQMTSLTGCAGESFASILRSLGFESHRVKKTDYETAQRKPAVTPTAPLAEEAGAAPAQASAPDTGRVAGPSAFELASDGEPTLTAPVLEFAEVHAEEPPANELAATVAQPPDAAEVVDAAATEDAPEAAEPVLADADPDDAGPAPEAPEAAAASPAAEPAEPASADPADAGPAPEAGEAASAPTTHAPEAAEPALAAAEPADAGPAPEAGEASVAWPAEDEWIEVWRPAPRRRPPPPPPPRRGGAPAGEGEAAGRPPRAAHGSRRHRGRERDAAGRQGAASEVQAGVLSPEASAGAAASEAPRESRSERTGAHRHGGRRPFGSNGPGKEDRRSAEGAPPGREPPAPAPKKEPRAQPVDMDSPFAKLLALKPLLERRDKRT
jgi:ATP-dependent RNA helicase SUPV3L1/SUV3